MAGNGPPPKSPERRARRNKDKNELRVIEVVPSQQPELPRRFKAMKEGGDTWQNEVDWPQQTLIWWEMWGASPLAADFTATDWSELVIAAHLHAEFMEGNYKLAGELRLRTAKFGATPEDRLRLRIQLAVAVDTEVTALRKVASARQRFGSIKVANELEEA